MKAEKITRRVLDKLVKPKPGSHKGDNGVLTIIGGSRQYHGALVYAVEAASRFVDLVYVYSPAKENNEVIRFLKKKTPECIVIPRSQLASVVGKSDCVLIGNGLALTQSNKRLVNALLKKHANKKFVLDAGALRVCDKRLFNGKVIVTPHAREFSALFGVKASESEVLRQARKWNCVVLLKGQTDYVSDGKSIYSNTTGNAGMTKGGTGDVLAGLCAALACKNNLLTAACTACFINGVAGDELKKKQGYWFNASDLAREISLHSKNKEESKNNVKED